MNFTEFKPPGLLFGELGVPTLCPRCTKAVLPEVESRILEDGQEYIVLRCPRCGFVPPHYERERLIGETSLEAVMFALWGPWYDAYVKTNS